MKTILRHKRKPYEIRPDFALVREVERELGSIPALAQRFAQMDWMVADLVTLTQMMLQSAGETVDYVTLGDAMLKGGLNQYLRAAQHFLHSVITGQDA